MLKPINITYWWLFYMSLGFIAFVYAIPENIMSYGWTNSLVDGVAQVIPAIEKLEQAYQQERVTGVALFFHTVKWGLLPMVLVALPWLTFCQTDRPHQAPKVRLTIAIVLFSIAFWLVSMNAGSLDGKPDRWFLVRYEIKGAMAVVGGVFDILMVVFIKVLIVELMSRIRGKK